ncbi:hypothetical protein SNEBB_006241 [Seison nebaliae]|nr:hypothetical protein SNEBB_006241 [Seison nebaliae]
MNISLKISNENKVFILRSEVTQLLSLILQENANSELLIEDDGDDDEKEKQQKNKNNNNNNSLSSSNQEKKKERLEESVLPEMDLSLKKVVDMLRKLKQSLERQGESIENFNILNCFMPFLVTIRSGKTSGTATTMALDSLCKFISYGFIPYNEKVFANSPVNEEARWIIACVFKSITKASFIGNDTITDELPLLHILQTYQLIMSTSIGREISDCSICEMIQGCFRICFELNLSNVLRKQTELVVESTIRRIFSRFDELQLLYRKLSEEKRIQKVKNQQIHVTNKKSINQDESNGDDQQNLEIDSNILISNENQKKLYKKLPHAFNLPCVREILRFLIAQIKWEDGENVDPFKHVFLHLLIGIFEMSAKEIGECVVLRQKVETDLCLHLATLLHTRTLTIFEQVLKLSFLIFQSLRHQLKSQFEYFYGRILKIISQGTDQHQLFNSFNENQNNQKFLNDDHSNLNTNNNNNNNGLSGGGSGGINNNNSINSHAIDMMNDQTDLNERKEMCLNLLQQFLLLPGFVSELYYNYDCDLYGMNLFEMTTEILAKNSFPLNEVTNIHVQSLNSLRIIIDVVSERCFYHSSDIFQHSCEWRSLMLTDKQLIELKRLKRIMSKGIQLFNKEAKNGIKYLKEQQFLKSDEDIARFIHTCPNLDVTQIGEYISRRQHANIRSLFMKGFDLSNQRIDLALRQVLESFRLPGEAPLIQLVIESFAETWSEVNDSPFVNTDAAFTLAYAIIMLHTDQHNKNVRVQSNPMTLQQFRSNLRLMNGGENFDQDLLKEIFDEIRTNEIVMPTEKGELATDLYEWKAIRRRQLHRKIVGVETDENKEKLSNLNEKNEERKKEINNFTRKQYVRLPSGALAAHLFDILWAPAISSFSFIFDRTDNVDFVRLTLDGFKNCAKIAAFYSLTNVFDNIVISLCKFTRLKTGAMDQMKNRLIHASNDHQTHQSNDGNHGTNTTVFNNISHHQNSNSLQQQQQQHHHHHQQTQQNHSSSSRGSMTSGNMSHRHQSPNHHQQQQQQQHHHDSIDNYQVDIEIALKFASSPKAHLAAQTLFYLTHCYGNMIRDGWHDLVDCIVQLCHCRLLPKEFLFIDVDGEQSSLAKEVAFVTYSKRFNLKENEKGLTSLVKSKFRRRNRKKTKNNDLKNLSKENLEEKESNENVNDNDDWKNENSEQKTGGKEKENQNSKSQSSTGFWGGIYNIFYTATSHNQMQSNSDDYAARFWNDSQEFETYCDHLRRMDRPLPSDDEWPSPYYYYVCKSLTTMSPRNHKKMSSTYQFIRSCQLEGLISDTRLLHFDSLKKLIIVLLQSTSPSLLTAAYCFHRRERSNQFTSTSPTSPTNTSSITSVTKQMKRKERKSKTRDDIEMETNNEKFPTKFNFKHQKNNNTNNNNNNDNLKLENFDIDNNLEKNSSKSIPLEQLFFSSPKAHEICNEQSQTPRNGALANLFDSTEMSHHLLERATLCWEMLMKIICLNRDRCHELWTLFLRDQIVQILASLVGIQIHQTPIYLPKSLSFITEDDELIYVRYQYQQILNNALMERREKNIGLQQLSQSYSLLFLARRFVTGLLEIASRFIRRYELIDQVIDILSMLFIFVPSPLPTLRSLLFEREQYRLAWENVEEIIERHWKNKNELNVEESELVEMSMKKDTSIILHLKRLSYLYQHQSLSNCYEESSYLHGVYALSSNYSINPNSNRSKNDEILPSNSSIEKFPNNQITRPALEQALIFQMVKQICPQKQLCCYHKGYMTLIRRLSSIISRGLSNVLQSSVTNIRESYQWNVIFWLINCCGSGVTPPYEYTKIYLNSVESIDNNQLYDLQQRKQQQQLQNIQRSTKYLHCYTSISDPQLDSMSFDEESILTQNERGYVSDADLYRCSMERSKEISKNYQEKMKEQQQLNKKKLMNDWVVIAPLPKREMKPCDAIMMQSFFEQMRRSSIDIENERFSDANELYDITLCHSTLDIAVHDNRSLWISVDIVYSLIKSCDCISMNNYFMYLKCIRLLIEASTNLYIQDKQEWRQKHIRRKKLKEDKKFHMNFQKSYDDDMKTVRTDNVDNHLHRQFTSNPDLSISDKSENEKLSTTKSNIKLFQKSSDDQSIDTKSKSSYQLHHQQSMKTLGSLNLFSFSIDTEQLPNWINTKLLDINDSKSSSSSSSKNKKIFNNNRPSLMTMADDDLLLYTSEEEYLLYEEKNSIPSNNEIEEDPSSFYYKITHKLLELLHLLHAKTAKIFEKSEQMSSNLFTYCWLPILRGMAGVCCDGRRQIRRLALNFLQRALLHTQMKDLSPNEWESCFNKVLFPLLTKLMEIHVLDDKYIPMRRMWPHKLAASISLIRLHRSNINNPKSSSTFSTSSNININHGNSIHNHFNHSDNNNNNALQYTSHISSENLLKNLEHDKHLTSIIQEIGNPLNLEESRMRVCTLLSKVFLQNLQQLATLSTFSALWLTILDYMDQYMNVTHNEQLTDAIPEMLKNMLLVMNTSGLFINEKGEQTVLANLTQDRVDVLLPSLWKYVIESFPVNRKSSRHNSNKEENEKNLKVEMEMEKEKNLKIENEKNFNLEKEENLKIEQEKNLKIENEKTFNLEKEENLKIEKEENLKIEKEKNLKIENQNEKSLKVDEKSEKISGISNEYQQITEDDKDNLNTKQVPPLNHTDTNGSVNIVNVQPLNFDEQNKSISGRVNFIPAPPNYQINNENLHETPPLPVDVTKPSTSH